jgi:sporulation protein YlmC with PRC-barrel domain
MRASDLLGAKVYDGADRLLGSVSDVRLVQDGPILGGWGAAFRVDGLVVSRPSTGSWLGYERARVRAPWALATLFRWLHRDAMYVAWDAVESVEHRLVRLRVDGAELPPVAPI